MKKFILLFLSLFILNSCNNNSSINDNYTSLSVEENTISSSESSSFTIEDSNSFINDNSSTTESNKSTSINYTNKIKIYINPSVQVNNLYYDKITTEAETMNNVAKIIYNKLSLDSRFIVYINDKMLSLTDSVKESNSYNVDYHIALHTNAGGGSGSEAFYYSNPTFANIILNSFVSTHSFPNRGVKKATNLYELKNSKAKNKSLIEFLFHDNEKESECIKNNYTSLASSIVNAFYTIVSK